MEIETKKYIIGGGITSLIFAYYNREYEIISPDVGGQLKNSGGIGPMYLHKDEFTEKLLKDLKIKAKVKRIKIGFLEKGKLFKQVDSIHKEKYFRKSRGLHPTEKCNVPKTALNCHKTYFEAYDIQWSEIIKAIEPHVKIIVGEVKKIYTNGKTILIKQYMRAKTLHYSHIFSTIPLFNLYNMIDDPSGAVDINGTTADICYAVSSKGPLDKKIPYSYVYNVGGEEEWYRVTVQENGKFIYEFIGCQAIETLRNRHPKLQIEKIVNIPFGKIVKNLDVKEHKGVKMLGRYSQINQKVKAEYVCKFAQEYEDEVEEEEQEELLETRLP